MGFHQGQGPPHPWAFDQFHNIMHKFPPRDRPPILSRNSWLPSHRHANIAAVGTSFLSDWYGHMQNIVLNKKNDNFSASRTTWHVPVLWKLPTGKELFLLVWDWFLYVLEAKACGVFRKRVGPSSSVINQAHWQWPVLLGGASAVGLHDSKFVGGAPYLTLRFWFNNSCFLVLFSYAEYWSYT